MAIAMGQARTGEFVNIASTNLAFLSNVTSGNLLLCVGGVWNGNDVSPVAVTDSIGTSYTVLEGAVSTGTPIRPWIGYGIAPSSGANTITFDPVGGGRYGSMTIAEFSGIDATPLDVDGSYSTGSSTAPSDSITTSAAGTVVIGLVVHGGSSSQTITEDSAGGWTFLGEIQSTSNAPHGTQYQIFSSAGAKTASWSLGSSAGWVAMTVSFKEPTATVTQPMARRGLFIPGMNMFSHGGPLP